MSRLTSWLRHKSSWSWKSSSGWDFEDLLAERHHSLYGRPWAAGRGCFDFLREEIKPDETVLDFGCGAGRIGIWLIPYLEESRYYGIERNAADIEAFRNYEIPLHGLQEKKPTLAVDDQFRVDQFGVRFDAILDIFVSYHLSNEDAARLFTRFSRVLKPGGRIFSLRPHGLPESFLDGSGLKILRTAQHPNRMLIGSSSRYPIDNWTVVGFD